ncbi:xanthine dehydrogenase family protein molybdopterin-binding subunit [Variovorax sp. PAMC 28711]|uniref:xanthine dehydrogenase family protein molybdopterin-binding subunit n=1 Tax=Variovorax sp. PAMC 28711 TaxID=1795631 RepID=UPI00078E0AEB|nr:xanthine dehydrogenase family protein molybdopterin-binding subunit [Variovorax sp. PAMC 28711]AMM26484.1 carbon monoxide dehydrogenase [Variovorax sp. PAMC 28711]
MSTETTPTRFGSGQAVRRLEDDALLAGAGRYTDDVSLPGQSHLVFVRSPYPHARIGAIDTAAASAMPGVLRVFTGAELAEAGVQPMPGAAGFKRADGSPCATPPRRVLAHERARFVGEPVVAVVAETIEQARDAAEAVRIDYDDLPMVVDLAGATADGAPLLCDEATGNIAAEMRHGSAEATAAAFATAKHVVALDIVNQRLVALTIEPRSVLADYDRATDRITVRMSTQMPSGVRDSVCAAIGLAKDKVRVVVGDVGGGFGMKTGAYPEDIAVAYAALHVKRPVKWVADRSEEFVSSAHGRDIEAKAELALAANGKILGLRIHTLANVGAYATGTGVAIQLLIGPWVQTSVYDIQTIDFHFKAVLTNTAPTGAYRGAGRPEAIYTMERLMDEAARQTGIDRIEIRRRNFIRPEQMPYTNPMSQTYDTGQFEKVMDQGLALADWDGFESRAAASAKQGKHRGLGIATFLEWTGGNVFEERVTVSVLADGVIEVFSAVNAMGQGIATSLAQLAVDAFGVPIEKVRIVLGDTDRGDGFGSAGSRSLFTGGPAVRVGSEKTIDKARQLAAKEFEAAADDVTYANGVFTVAGTDLKLDIFALAAKQPEHEIFVESTTTAAGPSWPNGCHICEIEIDPPTGEVAVVAYSSVNDVGRVVNPMIVRGQLEGGAVQGIGQALYERVVYDVETGQPVTGSLMDYAAPRADIIGAMFTMEMDESTPCKNNLLGVKGVGELGTIGATPAIVNAVADALARNGLAARAPRLDMPLSADRLWALMNEA